MALYRVNASVVASKFLGEFEAESAEEAVRLALEANGSVNLCHHCSDECVDPEIENCTAEEASDQYHPQPERPTMSGEVREAAELLRRGFDYAQCPDGWHECNASRVLATDYLEQNPADDEEAITIPFCESLGAEIAKGTCSSVAGWGIVNRHEDGTTILVDSAGNTIRWPVKITTRRALRDLLRGLGHDRKGNR